MQYNGIIPLKKKLRRRGEWQSLHAQRNTKEDDYQCTH